MSVRLAFLAFCFPGCLLKPLTIFSYVVSVFLYEFGGGLLEVLGPPKISICSLLPTRNSFLFHFFPFAIFAGIGGRNVAPLTSST